MAAWFAKLGPMPKLVEVVAGRFCGVPPFTVSAADE